MLKTITAFQIVDEATYDALHGIEDVLVEPTAGDPEKTAWWKAGFVIPASFAQSPVFVAADNTKVVAVQIRERVLPAKVIKEALKTLMIECERRQGYRPGRKQIAELKEQAVMELLPTSHIRPTEIEVVIVDGFLLVGTSSANKVDVVIGQLTALFPDLDTLALRPIALKRDVRGFLTTVLLEESNESGNFRCGQSVVLRGNQKSVARYKDINLASEPVIDCISGGMYPVELEVTFNEVPLDGSEPVARILFSLTDQLLIKRIRFSDFMLKQASDDSTDAASEYEATVAILGGELKKLISALLSDIDPIPDAKDESGDDEDEL